MVGLYCRDYPGTEQPTTCLVCPQYQDLPSKSSLHGVRIFLPLSEEDSSFRD